MPHPLLDSLLQAWRQQLTLWSQSGALSRAAEQALLLGETPGQLRELVGRWSAGSFEDLPPVVLLPASAIPSAAGAYALSTRTIYLNRDWLQTARREEALAVLTEELGHHLDGLLNRADTPGDEGEMFAALLTGDSSISDEQWHEVLAESDQGSVWLTGLEVPVERAALIISSPIQAESSRRTRFEWGNSSAFAAIRNDGSMVAWGGFNQEYYKPPSDNHYISQIFSNRLDFAALRSDGSVITRLPNTNPDGSALVDFDGPGNNLTVSKIFSTANTFAALRSDGSVVTWYAGADTSPVAGQLSSNVTQIFSTFDAFAALKSDGSVVTWGSSSSGGDSSGVDFNGPNNNLTVTQIFSSANAFAALRSDGSVVTWGQPLAGGDSSGIDLNEPNNNLTINQIFSSDHAFAAIRSDGSIVTWGHPERGGNSSEVDFNGLLDNLSVVRIYSVHTSFAALLSNGSVVTWGDPFLGGFSGDIDFNGPLDILRVTSIVSSDYAYAALRSDGSVVTWGDPFFGGDSSVVADQLSSGVTQIFSSGGAFAALKADGSVVTWDGDPEWNYGGDSSGVDFDGPNNDLKITNIFSTQEAFAALRSDGSVVTWGGSFFGGDSSGVDFDGPANNLKVMAFANPFTDDRLIFDSPLPNITLSVSAASALEDGPENLIYTFTRTGTTTSALNVIYRVGGTATLEEDFTGIPISPGTRMLSFAPGSSTATLILDPTADSTFEANETIALTLVTGTGYGYTIGTTAAVIGTIRNDDLPVITLALSQASVIENGNANLVYTFSRTGFTTNPLTVSYTLGGSATLGSDYTGIASTSAIKIISFAAGATTARVTIDPTADTIIEPDETVALTLVAASSYTIGTPGGVVGTITNDDPRITLAVSPASVTEDGSTNLLYTFTRSGTGDLTRDPLTVNYTVGGTATLGLDYTGINPTGLNQSITFAAGSTTARLTVDPTADTEIEPTETVALTLVGGIGYSIGTSTAVVGTITNDDPQITLVLLPVSVTEDGSDKLIYSFTRTGVTTNHLTVNYTVSGTASLGLDYTGISPSGSPRTITFAAGASTATVEVDPTADTTIETDETVSLTLAPGTGYFIGTTLSITGTIRNDDLPFVTLAVSPASVTEDGSSNLIYTFTRSGSGALSTTPLTVNYTVGGTAELGTDYTGIASTGATKSITFATGATTASVIVDPKGDATVEPDETVALTLSASTGYTIGTTSAVVGTILNDDPRVTLEISPTAVIEDDPTNLIYTFRRTGPTTSALTVNYTVAGTATLDTDYTGISPLNPIKTVTFAPGAALARVTVNPTADAEIEADETVALTLAAGSDYTLGTTTAVVGTIRNDDPKISLAVSPASVTEDGPANLIYTFTRTGAPTDALSVKYTVGGTAKLGLDYSGISSTGSTKTVTFAAGADTATVEVDPSADIALEWDETVDLTLVAGTGYTLGAKTWASGTIQNDDISSAGTTTLGATGSSLLLVGNAAINGTGNSLNNTLTGNSKNNRLTGLLGADVLTGGGTTDSDVFAYTSLNESLLGTGLAFDQITDFNSNDRLSAPPTLAKQRLISAVGNTDSLTEASIVALLTSTTFAANSVAAFTTTGQAGTFIAMNDARSGFQADSDAIILLRNYGISSTNVVEFV